MCLAIVLAHCWRHCGAQGWLRALLPLWCLLRGLLLLLLLLRLVHIVDTSDRRQTERGKRSTGGGGRVSIPIWRWIIVLARHGKGRDLIRRIATL